MLIMKDIDNNKPIIFICGRYSCDINLLAFEVLQISPIRDSQGFAIVEQEGAKFVIAPGFNGREQANDYFARINEWMCSQDKDWQRCSHGVMWYCSASYRGVPFVEDLDVVNGLSWTHAINVVVSSEIVPRCKETGDAFHSVLVSYKSKSGLPELLARTKEIIADMSGGIPLSFIEEWNIFSAKRCDEWERHIDSKVDSFIRWGTFRSFVLTIPFAIPMTAVIPLSLNEIYMVCRIAKSYGTPFGWLALGTSVIVLIAAFVGKLVGSMLPPVAKGVFASVVTYGVGKWAKLAYRKDFNKFKGE